MSKRQLGLGLKKEQFIHFVQTKSADRVVVVLVGTLRSFVTIAFIFLVI